MPIKVMTADRVSNPRDLHVGEDLLMRARENHMSLSALLEQYNPTPKDDLAAGKPDAFMRQLARFNIRLEGDQERGIPASYLKEFWEPRDLAGGKLEAEDWAGKGDHTASTERFFASNQPQSWALFPEYINRVIRAVPLAGDILQALIATTTMVDSNMYEALYLQDITSQRQLRRVAEGAEIPTIFTKVGMNAVSLSKYAIAIESTYEYNRRIRIPIFTIWLQRIAQQLRLDMSAQAADVLVNGDGNNNAAVNFNVSTLDPSAGAGPGTVTDPYLTRIGSPATSTISKLLTYNAFLQWRTSLYALGMDTIVGRMNEILQILTLQMPSINPTLLLGLLEGNAVAQNA